MSKNVRTQIGKVVGKSLDAYHKKIKPTIDELKFKEQYQGRIIDCMVGEVDDNYIETPETDAPIVKLEHSKEGVVKIPSIKGNTILVDADGNETYTPAEGCKLVSVGESEDNKLIILSKNKNLLSKEFYPNLIKQGTLHGMTFQTLEDGRVIIKGTLQNNITQFCKVNFVGMLEHGKRYNSKDVGIQVTKFDGTKTYGGFTFDKNTRRLAQVTMEGAEYACRLVESLDDRKGLLIAAGIITNPFNLQ